MSCRVGGARGVLWRGSFSCFGLFARGSWAPGLRVADLLAAAGCVRARAVRQSCPGPAAPAPTPPPGDGATTSCIAELLAAAVAQQTGVTVLEARQNMWLVDSSGLVTRGRWAVFPALILQKQLCFGYVLRSSLHKARPSAPAPAPAHLPTSDPRLLAVLTRRPAPRAAPPAPQGRQQHA